MQAITAKGPKLDMKDLKQQAAMPLASFLLFDPWTDQVFVMHSPFEPLLTAADKMPFEVEPVYCNPSSRSRGSSGSRQHCRSPCRSPHGSANNSNPNTSTKLNFRAWSADSFTRLPTLFHCLRPECLTSKETPHVSPF